MIKAPLLSANSRNNDINVNVESKVSNRFLPQQQQQPQQPSHNSKCDKVLNLILSICILNCFFGKWQKNRSKLYTSVTFTFSWCYFIGAIFLVPFAAQMALNSLATATAVAIFIKRKQLSLQHFRMITAVFTPIVISMSAYAVWNLRDDISQSSTNTATDMNSRELGLVMAFVNGGWMLLATVFIIVMDTELINKPSMVMPDSHVNAYKSNSIAYRSFEYLVSKIDPINGKFGDFIASLQLLLGVVYIVCSILFIRVNSDSMLILEIVTYMIVAILGSVCHQLFDKRYNLVSLRICTQLFILFLGISGTRLLYALLGNLDFDFSNILQMPKKIIAVTFLCWFFLLYRSLEVIEFTMSKK